MIVIDLDKLLFFNLLKKSHKLIKNNDLKFKNALYFIFKFVKLKGGKNK